MGIVNVKIEVFMKNDEKQLLDDYRKMTPQNKKHFLSLAYATWAAQETTKNEMSESAKKTKKMATA